MRRQLFHIFRNTPLGREALLHSKYFCQTFHVDQMQVYIPPFSSFNITFGMKEVIVFLDKSYMRDPESAKAHVDEILAGADITSHYYTCNKFKDRHLPEIPNDFLYMTCPKVLSEASGRIGLGHVGPGHVGPAVYSIVKHATFPIMIPSSTFQPWTSVSVLFGGSSLSQKAVKLGLDLAEESGLPIRIFTHEKRHTTVETCEAALEEAGLLSRVKEAGWTIWSKGGLLDKLYDIPRKSLVILGAAGQGPVKELAVGSMFQRIQPELPHPILIVGPSYSAKP